MNIKKYLKVLHGPLCHLIKERLKCEILTRILNLSSRSLKHTHDAFRVLAA